MRESPLALLYIVFTGAALLMGPFEIFDVLTDFRVAEILVRHGKTAGLLQHGFGVRVSLQHLLGGLEPRRQPFTAAAIGHAGQIRSQFAALTDRVTGQAFALEI